MRTKNIIIYVIVCLIIIAGVWVWDAKGFHKELQYTSRYEIFLSTHTEIKTSDVEEITNQVLGKARHIVQKTEVFGNAVTIVSEEMSEEQRNKIVEEFNKKYEDSELTSDDIEIIYIPSTRIKDVIKHYILPGIIATLIVLVYSIIRFKSLGWKEVLLKILLVPAVAELLLFSLIAITRIPFGRVTLAIGIGLYVTVILLLTCIFENQNNKNKEENNI